MPTEKWDGKKFGCVNVVCRVVRGQTNNFDEADTQDREKRSKAASSSHESSESSQDVQQSN
jgi:hypothetical protein